MQVEVHYTGNEFVAFDNQGNQIKDRSILEQISFIDFPGYKSSFKITLDRSTKPAILNPLTVNINTHT